MKIVAFAYACEPGKGSEPGAGWSLIQVLAHLGETWVITRTNNRENIERQIDRLTHAENIHFSYVDLPRWISFWKKGPRGMRLYYLLWQFAALRRVHALRSRHSFDCIWHLTVANAWIGSLAFSAGLPMIYGPVGGGIRLPLRMLRALGLKGAAYEAIRQLARLAARYLNPIARLSWRKANMILVQNEETASWFPARYRARVRIFQHAILTDQRRRPPHDSERTKVAIFAARLLPWKGGALALRAISRTPGWRLIVCGSGPDRARLENLARGLEIEDRVEFRGRISQEELFDLEIRAGAFLFPSLHDDAPLAVAEAVSAGLPVICLGIGGPPLIAGEAGVVIDPANGVRSVVEKLAQALDGELPSRETCLAAGDRLLLQNQADVLSGLIAEVIET